MAGLLEGFANWIEPLKSQSYYTRRAEAQELEKRKQITQGLLNQYGGSQAVAAAPGMGATSAPQRGPQGLLGPQGGQGGMLPPQFYHDLAAQTGDLAFLSQDQVGGQAMGRQVAQNIWDRDNLSAAQQATLSEQQRQFDTLGAADRARIEQMMAERAAVQGRWQQDRADTMPGGAMYQPPLPKPPTAGEIAEMKRQQENQLGVQSYTNAVKWFTDAQAELQANGYASDSPQARALDAAFAEKVLPARMKQLNTGALTEGDVALAKENAWQFRDKRGRLLNWELDEGAKALGNLSAGSQSYAQGLINYAETTGAELPPLEEIFPVPPIPGSPMRDTYDLLKEARARASKRGGGK